jgi:pimeloyl-ACP methyl ester carboxylesterase
MRDVDGGSLRSVSMLNMLLAVSVCWTIWLPLPAAGATILAPRWAPCTGDGQQGFQCTKVQVPLDYADPASTAITLSVIRHPATDPAHRIGTLFMNPGGPGGPGTVDLPDWITLFPPMALARFDIVSWDPRGINDSTAVQCFANLDDETAFFGDVPQNGFPVGLAEKVTWLGRFEAYGRICLQRNGPLLSHTSTADTARDMDLLRQALGEPTLNYLGTSYGTFLGAVYANLFPDNIRAMILDGNLTPSLYTNNGDTRPLLSSALRFGSNQGLSESLAAFLDQCGAAGRTKCSFSAGDARSTREKFQALLQRLRRVPVTIGTTTITYAVLLRSLEGRFFTTRPQPGNLPGWVGASALLDLVQGAIDAGGATEPATAPPMVRRTVAPGVEQKYGSSWQYLAIECGDSPNPRPPGKFLILDRYAEALYGPIGVVDLWLDEPCASWPVRAADQYIGPWNRPTPNPILLIGNTHDPSTPYRNSVGMLQELAQARLLTVEGYGHTVLLNPSRCAQQYEDDYLLNLALPPIATVCQQDKQPFE